jgi:murein DD-endopeptidase MepM/ murein hydrolase activator NlpD
MLFSLCAPSGAQIRGSSEAAKVRWTPNPAFPGSPILFRSTTVSGDATWLGRRIAFRPDEDGFSALAGVPLDCAPGRYPLLFDGQPAQVTVARHAYPSSRITVSKRFVEPPKEVEIRIKEEALLKRSVFESSLPERLWRGAFVAPADTRSTSPFGSRRVYNGKVRSIHQGLDYAAMEGTQVRAANAGRVAIARQFYFEGGFIAIDHGESIFTLYMHLSEFTVTEGVPVGKGAPIAKSGSSGRVTAAHLHFGVRWQGAYLEPLTLLRLWQR